MLTEKDYCDYDTCVALKKLGFNDVTHYFFNKDGVRTPRIPLYEAQKFLREEKKLHITIFSQSQESWQYRITKLHQRLEDGLHGEDFASYEEALLEGIKGLLKC